MWKKGRILFKNVLNILAEVFKINETKIQNRFLCEIL